MSNSNIILTFLLFLFTACDCQYYVSGVVLDKQTHKPISNVAIGKTNDTDLDNPFNKKTITSEDGKYEIHGIAGKCNKVTMYFTKEGYQTTKVTFINNTNNNTTFLTPID